VLSLAAPTDATGRCCSPHNRISVPYQRQVDGPQGHEVARPGPPQHRSAAVALPSRHGDVIVRAGWRTQPPLF